MKLFRLITFKYLTPKFILVNQYVKILIVDAVLENQGLGFSIASYSWYSILCLGRDFSTLNITKRENCLYRLNTISQQAKESRCSKFVKGEASVDFVVISFGIVILDKLSATCSLAAYR